MLARLILIFVVSIFSTLQCFAQQCGSGVAADLNGDNKPDLVIGNGTLNNIGVFINQGGGSFDAGTFLGLTNSADLVCLADFNSDGHLDILVFGQDANQVGSAHIFFGGGKGGFSAPVAVSIPGFSLPAGFGAVVGDFNNDGHADIAYSARGTDPAGNGSAISILLGDGTGGFSAPHTTQVVLDSGICCGPSFVGQMEVVDANHDGKPDLLVAVAVHSFTFGYLALGDGQGGFFQIVPIGSDSAPLFVADVNGDGNTDFIAGDIFYGDGQGGIFYHQPSPGRGLGVLDVDGDHKVDMLTQVGAQGGYLPGNGHGGFGDLIPITFPKGNLVVAADLNGDGKPDFVFRQDGSTSISVVLNNTTPPSPIPASTTMDVNASASTTSTGTSVTLWSRVTSSGGTPAGTVTFTDGTTTVGTAAVNIYGIAALATSFSTGGTHTITSSFTGGTDTSTNTSFGNSSSTSIQIIVNNTPQSGPPPAVTVTATPDPARQNNPVQLANTVTSSSGTPTGIVFFEADGDVIGGAIPQSHVNAVFPVAGLHDVKAVYGGDVTFPPASSPILVEDIRALNAVRDSSTTHVTATSVFQNSSAGINMSATVTGGTHPPTANVTFRVDGAVFTSVAPGATAFLPVNPGTYIVAADYPGDATLTPSTASTTVTVNPPPGPDYSVSASPQSATITAGQSATFVFTVTPSGGFSSPVSFACGTLPMGANCTFSQTSVTPNGAPITDTLIISTTAPHTATLVVPPSPPGFNSWLLAVTFTFGLVMTLAMWKGTRGMRLIAAPVALGFLLLLASCGGGGSGTPPPPNTIPGTPHGTTQITISTTSATNHSVPITLTVQ